MAEAGLVFDRFYAAAPVCSPTRGSVLTGRHPFRLKITNHGRYITRTGLLSSSSTKPVLNHGT